MKWSKNAKMFRVVSIVFLTVVLFITACSKENNTTSNSGDSAKSTSTQNQNSSPSSNTAGQETEKRGSISVTLYDRNNVPPEEGTTEDNRWTKWINENGPVDVEYVAVPRWESLQKLNTLFATNSAPDLILEYDTGYRNQWYGQQLLRPIDDMIENYSTEYKALMEQFPQLRKLGTKDDGQLYEIGRVNPLIANHRIYIRQDWLDQLNLSMPKTTEEFLEVAKAFTTKDPDQNGLDDTFGVNLSGTAFLIIAHMFGHGEVDWNIENGQFVHEWERLAAAVDFQKQLFEAGVADRDFLTDKNGEKARQDFLSGKLGIYMYQYISEKDYDTFKSNAPNGKLSIMQLPKSKYGQFSPVISSPIQMVATVSASTKDPESVMRYIDFMIKPETAETIRFGVKGVHWEEDANGCPIPIDPEKNKIEIYNGDNGDLNMMASRLLLGKCSFNSSLPQDTESQKAIRDLILQADKAYVSRERPIPTLKPEYLPILPQDLSLIVKNVEIQIGIYGEKEIWLKAIVGGDSYTAEQALADAQHLWKSSGGEQVDAYYAKWYEENQSTMFSLDDLYDFGEQSERLYNGGE